MITNDVSSIVINLGLSFIHFLGDICGIVLFNH